MIRQPYKNTWPRKNLGELLNFLDRIYPEGYTLDTLAEKFGVTRESFSQMFRGDDAKLSKAEAIARAYGYRLTLYFPQKTRLLGELHTSAPRHTYPDAGNLAGLVKYIQDSNISIHHMGLRIGRRYGPINAAFSKGDIKISMLYEILKNLNINVIWNFEKL